MDAADGLFPDEDFELEEDSEPCFCPYCYKGFDLPHLCAHLEEEHRYDTAPTFCSVCSQKVMGDLVDHITEEHAQLLSVKRMYQSHSTSTLLLTNPKGRAGGGGGGGGGGGATRLSVGGASSSTSLKASGSGLRRSVAVVEDRLVIPQVVEVAEAGPTPVTSTLSLDPKLSVEERREKTSQAAMRAKFARQLVLSAMLRDV